MKITTNMMRRNQNYGARAEKMVIHWSDNGMSFDAMRSQVAYLHNREEIKTPLRNRLMCLIYDIEAIETD